MATISTAQYWTTVRREPFLVGYWRNNEGAGLTQVIDYAARYDLLGTYQSSQVLGSPLIQADATAGSTILGSGNAGFSVSDTSVLEITGDLSLEAWIAPFSTGQSCHLIGKLDSTKTYAAPYALRLSSGTVQLALGDGSSEETLTSGVPPVSVPTHVVATAFRGAMKVFINGVVSATGSLGSQTVSDGAEPLYVGAAGTSSPFSGMMSEVAVYDGALSATRAARHYSLGQQVYPDPAHYLGVDAPVLVA